MRVREPREEEMASPMHAAAAVLREEMNVCGDARGCQCEDSIERSEQIAAAMLEPALEMVARRSLEVAR